MVKFIAKTAFLASALAFALCATAADPKVEATPPQAAKAVLGIVTPGQTTLAEAATALKQKGCEYKEETVTNQGRKITVAPGCFQLVGDPRVIFVGPEETKPIGNVWLEFDPGLDQATYQCYLDTLKGSYGAPTTTGFEGGVRYALWNASGRGVVVILVGNEQTGPRLINYYIGDLAKQLWEEFQKRHATTDEDMKTL